MTRECWLLVAGIGVGAIIGQIIAAIFTIWWRDRGKTPKQILDEYDRKRTSPN